MKKIFACLLPLLVVSAAAQTLLPRHSQVIERSRTGIAGIDGLAVLVPYAKIYVGQLGCTGVPCQPLANIYSDLAGTQLINQITTPLTSSAKGDYAYNVAPGIYVEQFVYPGTPTYTQTIYVGAGGALTTLQTNGTNNPLQSLINFTNTNGVSWSADSSGHEEVSVNVQALGGPPTYNSNCENTSSTNTVSCTLASITQGDRDHRRNRRVERAAADDQLEAGGDLPERL